MLQCQHDDCSVCAWCRCYQHPSICLYRLPTSQQVWLSSALRHDATQALARQVQTATTMLGVDLRHTQHMHQRGSPTLWFVCRKNQQRNICQRCFVLELPKTSHNLRMPLGAKVLIPYANACRHCVCGSSVQHGLSATGAALGFFTLGLAADKR